VGIVASVGQIHDLGKGSSSVFHVMATINMYQRRYWQWAAGGGR
jgi:hypothetical protein